jgi:hypothetical protein
MPYITREDGERFVVPSYRDVLTAKRKDLLKKEIVLLSQSYGEYITLQRKDADRYEVTLSPDAGYLLGESIWQYFKRPNDLVYCELLPNGTDAILVIVIAGSVYLDGSFPVDSIPEELVIFKTQKNNFEIYISGEVPIAKTAEGNKFIFDETSVKSFSVLDKPIFPSLPLYKPFQLQLVERALAAQGIGALPIKPILAVVILIGLGWWFLASIIGKKEQVLPAQKPKVDPYATYYQGLASPAPDQVITQIFERLNLLATLPGWIFTTAEYVGKELTVAVKSQGSSMETLQAWAQQTKTSVQIKQNGVYLNFPVNAPARPRPKSIYPLQSVLSRLIDRLAVVNPGNNLQMSNFDSKVAYTVVAITVKFDRISPTIFELLGEQFKDLPLVLQKVSVKTQNGSLSGTIIIQALGSQS